MFWKFKVKRKRIIFFTSERFLRFYHTISIMKHATGAKLYDYVAQPSNLFDLPREASPEEGIAVQRGADYWFFEVKEHGQIPDGLEQHLGSERILLSFPKAPRPDEDLHSRSSNGIDPNVELQKLGTITGITPAQVIALLHQVDAQKEPKSAGLPAERDY